MNRKTLFAALGLAVALIFSASSARADCSTSCVTYYSGWQLCSTCCRTCFNPVTGQITYSSCDTRCVDLAQ